MPISILIILYKPPRSPSFLETILDILIKFNTQTNLIIIGEFNTNPNLLSFNNIINDVNMTQHITELTHIKGNILDLVIST